MGSATTPRAGQIEALHLPKKYYYHICAYTHMAFTFFRLIAYGVFLVSLLLKPPISLLFPLLVKALDFARVWTKRVKHLSLDLHSFACNTRQVEIWRDFALVHKS